MACPSSSGFDNRLLIEEVKSRPPLYDKSLPGYNDHNLKKRLWEQVAERLYNIECWSELEATERETKYYDVIKRWNNIRTHFTRVTKNVRDPFKTKPKYLYYDQLLFLLEHSNWYNEDKEEENTVEDTPIKRKDVHGNIVAAKRTKTAEKNTNNFTNENDNKSYNEEKTILTDGDTNFALSLVPLLKMVPLSHKIGAHIEILNVIQKYTQTNFEEVVASDSDGDWEFKVEAE